MLSKHIFFFLSKQRSLELERLNAILTRSITAREVTVDVIRSESQHNQINLSRSTDLMTKPLQHDYLIYLIRTFDALQIHMESLQPWRSPDCLITWTKISIRQFDLDGRLWIIHSHLVSPFTVAVKKYTPTMQKLHYLSESRCDSQIIALSRNILSLHPILWVLWISRPRKLRKMFIIFMFLSLA